MRSDDLLTTAYHEAGHAVIQLALGLSFDHVSIDQSDDSLGRVKTSPPWWSRNTAVIDFDLLNLTNTELKQEILVLLSGGIAQLRQSGHSDGDRADLELAARFAEEVAGDSWESALHSMHHEATAIVNDNWRAISDLARALVDHTTLTQEEAIKAVGDQLVRRQIR